ncbi:MAG TPA: hypothetical protein PLD25_31710 [Chloroflexota bacterium]|nr:hypothetical protein [Chloroflexota bacterium]HUM67609.1 hypothetical protein [Chloroflexota bacterium]
MPYIKVYHNPHFLDYNGDHSQIVPPTQPVASILVPAGISLNERLGAAYAQTQHGYNYSSWFHDPQVIPHLRSTAVGDLIADHEGNFYVVEHFGFQPYQPATQDPVQLLVEAYRWLETACMESVTPADGALLSAARRALVAMQHTLATEETHPARRMSVHWENAQPGDLVGHPEMGQFRVIARKLRPKWRAKRLLAYIPIAQIWIDRPGLPQQARDRLWAVLVPINEETNT